MSKKTTGKKATKAERHKQLAHAAIDGKLYDKGCAGPVYNRSCPLDIGDLAPAKTKAKATTRTSTKKGPEKKR